MGRAWGRLNDGGINYVSSVGVGGKVGDRCG